jgi:hypothetical protein
MAIASLSTESLNWDGHGTSEDGKFKSR